MHIAAITPPPDEATASAEDFLREGAALRAAGQPAAAVSAYRHGLALCPDAPEFWSNLGNALRDLREFDTAIASHHRALALAPRSAGFLINLGTTLAAAGQDDEAAAVLTRALLFAPNDANLHWNRALAELRQGNLMAGWTDYAARLESGAVPHRDLPGKPWVGEPAPGQTLLVAAEQGFGDSIWAVRYLRDVQAMGFAVVLETTPELAPLLRHCWPGVRVVTTGDVLPHVQWHTRLCSLPGLFTTQPSRISAAPYLAAPPDRMTRAAELLAPAGRRKRVGIVWSGSQMFKGNAGRAATLEQFLHVFALPGVQLFSLQMGPPGVDLATRPDAPVIDLAPALRDFADTAAVAAQLDLVVMTDSAVAHLCGALGVPVWVLLGDNPFWLWSTGSRDPAATPWYRSVRLFRQRAPGCWTSPFDAASTALLELADPRAL
jgi:tetratricopeptide (TPR) repeat protein